MGAVERAPEVLVAAPLHVVGDEQVGLAVAVVVEPGGAGAEVGVFDPRRGRHVPEPAAALVVEQPVAVERGEVDVLAAVVVVVARRDAHAVDLDVEAAPPGGVGEGAVAVVAVEGRQRLALARLPVAAVDQQDVEPAVAVGVEQRHAGAHGLGQVFLPRAAAVVGELHSRGGGDIGEPHPRLGRGGFGSGRRRRGDQGHGGEDYGKKGAESLQGFIS